MESKSGEADRAAGRGDPERERVVADERLRLAARAAHMGFWEWDVPRDLTTWDERMSELHGRTSEGAGASQASWFASIHPDDRARIQDAVRGALEGAPFETSFRVVHPDGAVRHLRSAAAVVRDPGGCVERMIGVSWDVTPEHEVQSAIRASKALLRQFVRHAPAAIAMLDREVRYLEVSDRWVTEYGLEGQEILGRSHYDVFPQLPERWRAVHRRVLEGAVERCEDDVFHRPDGRAEWLQWEARPWHRTDGSIGGLMFFTQITTARKELELLLQARQDELERSNRDLEQFAYSASHDLQEPLRAVAGCAQLLERKYAAVLDDDGRELVGHMVDGAERMRALITGLLAYSRVTSHGAALVDVDAGAAVETALQNLEASITETSARVTRGPLPRVRADATQLTQVFQNLVGNALKYRRGTPHVGITADDDGGFVHFRVQDDGIGIEPVYFEKIFVLFQRLHTRSEYPGVGIGLALCQRIVQRHGGRLWLESEPDVGSVFHFTMPAGSRP